MSDNISKVSIDKLITKRVRCDYDLLEQRKINLRKTEILTQLELLSLEGKSVIYENQEIIASKVLSEFKNRKIINVMVISKTQSGKTGSMCATIKQYLEDTSNLIPTENIYIITGLSSCEWKEQTKERIPESIQKRVFHRCDLPTTFVDEIKDKKNIILIMDEIQVAAKTEQTIYKAFELAGLLNKSKLYENDIKILEYTATPDGTIYDLMKWEEASSKILADGGEGYVSSYDLLKMGRVKQYKELCGYNKKTGEVDKEVFENIQEIKKDIDTYIRPLYHIIRTKNGSEQDITINNLKKIFNIDYYNYIKYDYKNKNGNINDILKKKPEKHTIFLFKEGARCAITLVKTNIGILYDRCSKKPDDATIIQGLIGRDTGYDNNGISICYTNIPSIEKYEKLWLSNFEDKTIVWNSKTTICKNGVVSGKNTFNDPTYYGFSESNDNIDEIKEPIIKIFATQEEVKEYCIKNLKKRGPNKKSHNNEGYYEAIIRSIKKIYSCDEIKCGKKYGISKNDNYRLYPCYKDINDKTTLQWWFIHY